MCPVCRGSARAERMQAANDDRVLKAMGENAPPKAVRPSDGRRTFVKLLSPLEVEAAKAASGAG